ncbi:VOC family protein [Phaeodactylibacter sp.]|uniref:VOC family protein n=1 Tax=Phaeodactylibacter sp. TaxID=1940289 RepID=UPI0025EB6ADF|nr:VOC family protein [Phaeodactylibacter sp.]MCI4648427.1 VOC family protein [Phaeodactylibacter sp.]MCI5093157.1 VOC family protein [Phaeodactylibacter sp.]
MNAVNWFEIAVDDLERAKKFYEAVFEKELQQVALGEDLMALFPYDPQIANASGALVKGRNYTPGMSGTKIYFHSEDVNNELARVEKLGGQIVMAKTNIGDFGNIAFFQDTEGNLIGLHSRG